MIIGFVGRGALTEVLIKRVIDRFVVKIFPQAGTENPAVSDCDVIVFAEYSALGIKDYLKRCGLLVPGPVRARFVIDQTTVDPDQTRSLALELVEFGLSLIDAPIQCEKVSVFPESSATFCGGSAAAVDALRPLLETMCPKLIYFGESGSGHTANALVSAIAACNRMITYECAALGFKNGLSIQDMATVLNRSSGANSATEHVLPFLADRQSTSDALLSDMVFKLRLVSQLAMRAGTPIVLSNLVADLCQSASNQLGSGALVDSLVGSVESSAGVTFK